MCDTGSTIEVNGRNQTYLELQTLGVNATRNRGDNSHNMIQNCSDELLRSEQLLERLTEAERYLIVACGVLCLLDVIILIDNIVFIWRKHTTLKRARVTSTWLVALCPVLAVVALTAMLVPRVYLFRDASIAVSQALVMYKFVQLLGTYVATFTTIRQQILVRQIRFDVRPFCCCCRCFPTARVNRTNIKTLKALVLQYSVIVIVITQITMVTWLDEKYIPGKWMANNPYPYLSVIQVISVLTAIYALNILVSLCLETMQSLYVKQKFNSLSLCLIFFSLQGFIFDIMTAKGVFDVRECIPDRVLGNFYKNLVFCLEMFLLTLFNLWSYRRPLVASPSAQDPDNRDVDKVSVQNIVTITREHENGGLAECESFSYTGAHDNGGLAASFNHTQGHDNGGLAESFDHTQGYENGGLAKSFGNTDVKLLKYAELLDKHPGTPLTLCTSTKADNSVCDQLGSDLT